MPFTAGAIATAMFGGVLAVLSDNDVQALLGFFTCVTAVITAILGYLANRKGKNNGRAIQAINEAVNAPREISTDREEGVRVEPPIMETDE